MINSSNESDLTRDALNDRVLSTPFNNPQQHVLSVDQFEQLIINLSDSDKMKPAGEFLKHYFSHFPFTFSTTYLKVLFEFYKSENQKNLELISLISEVLTSLFLYNDQNMSVFEVMNDENFYNCIWGYIDYVPQVMILFKWLIKTFDSAFLFALNNEIIEKLLIIIFPENSTTIILFDFISAFARYTQYYDRFFDLINCVCNITFSTINIDIFSSGLSCISVFSKRCADIALQVFRNQSFFEYCQILNKDRPDTLRVIIHFIDQTLQNAQILSKNGLSGCLGSFLSSQFNDQNTSNYLSPNNRNIILCIFNIICISLSMNDESLQKMSLHALSSLIFGSQLVKYCISNNLHQLLFKIARSDFPFLFLIEVFRTLSSLVAFSDKDDTKILIDMGYISLIEEQIEIMSKIPNIIISALENIESLGETYQDVSNWSDLIFSNETIVNQLQFIIDHPLEVEEDDYHIPVDIHARALLERRSDCF
ncbi:hypothetical protein TRFO_28611 [Tritrichomonas foetus]|uniref:Uncharacterized protein n=1 Tax=Tritrichomonas foetus TaxID=1144522 RepID=A0A1J4JZU5_9EUKA|nr:hypothetical protein TRFO_28611 [Tritrichomonas foetus]|eukprot:OHT04008.1 hypothetical protein TRFO_28611 [Tritrichomonas foetus]